MLEYEVLSNMEHLKLNEALGIHEACDERMDHLRTEWIFWQMNGSPEKGHDMGKWLDMPSGDMICHQMTGYVIQ